MRQFAELRDRVTRLEGRVGNVEEEVADWRDALNSHAKTLNAMREDLVDVRTEMRAGFADVRSEMRDSFGKLAKGQELITDLLTRHLGEPCEETRAGDAGE